MTALAPRWRPLRPGHGLYGLPRPWRHVRRATFAVVGLAALFAFWPPAALVAPPTAVLSEEAPLLAGRLVAGVRERLPTTAGTPDDPLGTSVAETSTAWPVSNRDFAGPAFGIGLDPLLDTPTP
ncbi:MAG: hypothetical protein M3442_12350 [Chloroflexota bacterium]|nr:hypothetical protein [Chloroflexota bacterium]